MEETLMMGNKELAQHIEKLQAEVQELYNETGFEFVEKQDDLANAVEEARSRGYENLEDLKESI